MELPTRKGVRAIAYARTSKVLNQDPQLQIQAIRQYAEQRGYQIVAEYVDQVSGDRERRKGLDQLILDCKLGRTDLVICTALDRIFRSTKHMLAVVDELNHCSVRLQSLRENLQFDTPAGAMALTCLAAVATLEKSIIGDRIRVAMAMKRASAATTGWTCGRKPLPKEIADKVLELRQSGLSIRSISRQVGISKSSVERILKKAA